MLGIWESLRIMLCHAHRQDFGGDGASSLRMRHENKKRRRNYASAAIPPPSLACPTPRRTGRPLPLASVALTEVEISIEGGGGMVRVRSLAPHDGGVFD